MASGDCIPPTSQIPGLASHSENDDGRRRTYIRETDSEYIKLAKQGGTKGLLSIETPVQQNEAVGYPRSDWFGHHQMEKEDQQKILAENKWKAPDYMTHEMVPEKKLQVVTPDVEKQPDTPEPAKVVPRQLTAREERMLIQAKYNNREVPYQSDNLSCWERKEEEPSRRSRLRK